jgi:hypothetical protein
MVYYMSFRGASSRRVPSPSKLCGDRHVESISIGQSEWCDICRQWGHVPPHCPTLQKYQTMTHTPFCEFCKSIGHDVNSCRSLQLMQDNTQDAFWVQEEKKGGEHSGTNRGDIKEDPKVDMGMCHDHGYGGGGGRPPTCFNCGEIGHVS